METIRGIYRIMNRANGKVYIGSSKDAPKRLKRHRQELTAGKHRNRYLQQEWDAYGGDVFAFEVVERSEAGTLLGREQAWLNAYLSWLPECGYNQTPYTRGPLYLRIRGR